LQTEDDISASVVVPASALKHLNPEYANPSVKFVCNTESRLFQRPDEAIHRGYDQQTEKDLSEPDNFLSNFQPLTACDARELVEDSIGFATYTEPMQHLILDALKKGGPRYFVSSAHPRMVDGQPSKNPRYLQKRPDLVHPPRCLCGRNGNAFAATHFIGRHRFTRRSMWSCRAAGITRPDPTAHIRSLAVFNPVHYMELAELFMEFISSMTGKSPSTTGPVPKAR